MKAGYTYQNNTLTVFSFIVYLIAIFILNACKTTQTIVVPETPQSEESIMKGFLSPPEFTFFSGKARIKLSTDEDNQKATMFIRAKRDSFIFLAVKKLSVEAVRALITHDSVYVINRLDKNYEVISIEEIKNQYGLTPQLNYIFDMLSGTAPVMQNDVAQNLSYEGNYLAVEVMIQGLLHKFLLDRYTANIIEGRFMDQKNFSGDWQFRDYRLIGDSISLPFNRYYNVNLPNGEKFNASLDFSEIELDVEHNINFTIPSHYTKLNRY